MIATRIVLVIAVVALTGCSQPPAGHHSVRTTIFWVGEPATPDSNYISNTASAWQNNWLAHYGGVDDPTRRVGYRPEGFIPQENPFYFALPYSDYVAGRLKQNVTRVPWYHAELPLGTSLVKNHWIEVSHNGHTTYGQWEDAGPLGEDDFNYVFGSAQPHFRKAGLDLSPAMARYIRLDGVGRTTWHFVDEAQVPPGPWKDCVTTSQIDWQ